MGNIYEVCCVQPQSSPRKPQINHQKANSTILKKQENVKPLAKQITWNDFQFYQESNKGQFGKVALVKLQNSTNNKYYVMKIISKTKIKEKNLLQDPKLQNLILSQSNPFITKVFNISQNKLNIYIVMEYIQGRDLYYYLKGEEQQSEKKFPQQTIKQIAAETILGIQFLHSKEIIYRQLKPQNLLCTTDGHIKLTDYVLSRLEKIDQPTLTYLGNVQYTAPQMLYQKKGYNRYADLWSLGILLYELCVGRTPFSGFDAQKIQQKIIIGKIQFPSNVVVSQNLKDLILQLTKCQPQQRLKLQQVKKHAFFSSVNWDDVYQRRNNTGLVQIMANYNLEQRGQNDNPPARLYVKQLDRKQSLGPFVQFTCTTQQSFRMQ